MKHSLILLPTGEYLDTAHVVTFIYREGRLKFMTSNDARFEFIVPEKVGERWCVRLAAERGGGSPLIPESEAKPQPQPETELQPA